MSNVVEKTLSLVFKWEPPLYVRLRRQGTILSKMINYQGEKLFQVGLRNKKYSKILLFITFGLSKLGLDDDACIVVTGPDNFRLNMSLKKVDKDPPSIQLYEATCNNVWPAGLSFTFHVYLATSTKVPNYHLLRVDDLLGLHLWSAALDEEGTDFELIAGQRRFPVHKFILAARSPVFAACLLAQENPGGQKTTRTYFQESASTLEQFLKFIYTGKLEGVVSHPLYLLAEEYKIDTLTRLYYECLPQEDDLTRVAKLLKENENFAPEIRPDTESKVIYNPDGFSFTWMIHAQSQEHPQSDKIDVSSLASGGFGIGSSNRMFSAEIFSLKELHQFRLTFFVHQQAEKTCCVVQEVICSWSDSTSLSPLEMVTPEVNSPQQFFVNIHYDGRRYSRRRHLPYKINFFVRLVSRPTVPTFTFKPCDLLHAKDIWSATTAAKIMTDAVLIVGRDEPISFHAHRFILSARSPVFAVMFQSDFEEARTGVVRIRDIDPDTFGHFFKFLYTGLLPIDDDDRPLKERLYVLADKYDVATLMDICRPFSPEDPDIDVE